MVADDEQSDPTVQQVALGLERALQIQPTDRRSDAPTEADDMAILARVPAIAAALPNVDPEPGIVKTTTVRVVEKRLHHLSAADRAVAVVVVDTNQTTNQRDEKIASLTRAVSGPRKRAEVIDKLAAVLLLDEKPDPNGVPEKAESETQAAHRWRVSTLIALLTALIAAATLLMAIWGPFSTPSDTSDRSAEPVETTIESDSDAEETEEDEIYRSVRVSCQSYRQDLRQLHGHVVTVGDQTYVVLDAVAYLAANWPIERNGPPDGRDVAGRVWVKPDSGLEAIRSEERATGFLVLGSSKAGVSLNTDRTRRVVGEPEALEGGDGDDILCGGSGDDAISGSSGDDVLFGDRGEDVLDGDDGVDILIGTSDDREISDRFTDDFCLKWTKERFNCESTDTGEIKVALAKAGIGLDGSAQPSCEAPYAIRLGDLPFNLEQINAGIGRNGPWHIGTNEITDGISLRCGGNWYFDLGGSYSSVRSNVAMAGTADGTGFLNIVVNGATVELLELETTEVKRFEVPLGPGADELRLSYNYEPTVDGTCPALLVFCNDVLIGSP